MCSVYGEGDTSAPVLSDAAIARPQGRIIDLVPNTWGLGYNHPVSWDTESRRFALDTWNDIQTNEITSLVLSISPAVMLACVEYNDQPVTDFIADLRHMRKITHLGRMMWLGEDGTDIDSPNFKHYVRTHGTVLLNNVILPEADGAHYYGRPAFEESAIWLADEVDRLALNIRGSNRARAPRYIEAAYKYAQFNQGGRFKT